MIKSNPEYAKARYELDEDTGALRYRSDEEIEAEIAEALRPKLTLQTLEDIYKEMTKSAAPTRHCVFCGQAVFSNAPENMEVICFDCQ